MVIRKGTKVKWKLGKLISKGIVEKTFKDKVTRNIQGAPITRYGQKKNKVLLIKQENGGETLKLENEVERE